MTYDTHAVGVPQLEADLLAQLDRVDVDQEHRSLLEHGVEVVLDDARRVQRLLEPRVRERDVWVC